MKTPVKVTQSLAFQKNIQSSPVQSSGVNEHLSLAPYLRIKPIFSLNLFPSVVKIFRRISTCNFFYTSIDAYEFFSEVRKEPLKLHYTEELRSLELTLALVQINRNILNR